MHRLAAYCTYKGLAAVRMSVANSWHNFPASSPFSQKMWPLGNKFSFGLWYVSISSPIEKCFKKSQKIPAYRKSKYPYEMFDPKLTLFVQKIRAGFFEQSMEARNRVGIGLSYSTQAGGINSLEFFPPYLFLHTRLKIRAQAAGLSGCFNFNSPLFVFCSRSFSQLGTVTKMRTAARNFSSTYR